MCVIILHRHQRESTQHSIMVSGKESSVSQPMTSERRQYNGNIKPCFGSNFAFWVVYFPFIPQRTKSEPPPTPRTSFSLNSTCTKASLNSKPCLDSRWLEPCREFIAVIKKSGWTEMMNVRYWHTVRQAVRVFVCWFCSSVAGVD